mgnify:CR=1 FL=1
MISSINNFSIKFALRTIRLIRLSAPRYLIGVDACLIWAVAWETWRWPPHVRVVPFLALDGSDTAIAQLKQRADRDSLDIDARCVDLSNFALNESFDTILCIGLLMFFDRATALKSLAQIRQRTQAGGIAIVNALVCEVVARLAERGLTPPVFMSANLDGGDAFNARLLRENAHRIHYLA